MHHVTTTQIVGFQPVVDLIRYVVDQEHHVQQLQIVMGEHIAVVEEHAQVNKQKKKEKQNRNKQFIYTHIHDLSITIPHKTLSFVLKMIDGDDCSLFVPGFCACMCDFYFPVLISENPQR